MTDTFDGGCACGVLRYRMRSRPMFVHCCPARLPAPDRHCVRAERLDRGRPGRVALRRSQALRNANRQWPASHCVPLPGLRHSGLDNYGGLTKLSFLRVGTLDDPTGVPPDVHIYTRSKLPSINLPHGVPAFDAYYSSRELWPADSLERRKAVMG